MEARDRWSRLYLLIRRKVIQVADLVFGLFVCLVCLAGIALLWVIACAIFAVLALVVLESFETRFPLDP